MEDKNIWATCDKLIIYLNLIVKQLQEVAVVMRENVKKTAENTRKIKELHQHLKEANAALLRANEHLEAIPYVKATAPTVVEGDYLTDAKRDLLNQTRDVAMQVSTYLGRLVESFGNPVKQEALAKEAKDTYIKFRALIGECRKALPNNTAVLDKIDEQIDAGIEGLNEIALKIGALSILNLFSIKPNDEKPN